MFLRKFYVFIIILISFPAFAQELCIDKKFKIDYECKCRKTKCFNGLSKSYKRSISKSTNKKIVKYLYKNNSQAYKSMENLFKGVRGTEKELKKIQSDTDKIIKAEQKLFKQISKTRPELKKLKTYAKKYKQKYIRKNSNLKNQLTNIDKYLPSKYKSSFSAREYALENNKELKEKIVKISMNQNMDMAASTDEKERQKAIINNQRFSDSDLRSAMDKKYKNKTKFHGKDTNLFSIISNRYTFFFNRKENSITRNQNMKKQRQIFINSLRETIKTAIN